MRSILGSQLNLHRRHLNESQRAMVAARLANMRHGGDRKSDQGRNSDLDAKRAAKMLNVDRSQVALFELQNRCAEYKLRAEYKLGQMLQGLQRGVGARGKAGPGRGNKRNGPASCSPVLSDYRQTLEENGIAEWSAERWQIIASHCRRARR